MEFLPIIPLNLTFFHSNLCGSLKFGCEFDGISLFFPPEFERICCHFIGMTPEEHYFLHNILHQNLIFLHVLMMTSVEIGSSDISGRQSLRGIAENSTLLARMYVYYGCVLL